MARKRNNKQMVVYTGNNVRPRSKRTGAEQVYEEMIGDLRAEIAALKSKPSKVPRNKLTSAGKAVTGLGQAIFHGGNAASQYFGMGKIFGEGAYKMTNSKWNTGSQVPFMHSDNEKVVIRHREYIGDVIPTSAAFQMQYSIPINPGIETSFPYLSTIANCFQEYRFRGLVYEFKTQSGQLTGGNTALGDVMMVAQYRADASPPTTKVELLNEMWSTSVVPSDHSFLPIECDPKENPFKIQFVRSSTPSGDIKTFDVGNMYLATIGTPQNFLGELHVTYEVELYKPKLDTGAAGLFSGSAASYTLQSVSTSISSGATPVVTFDNIGCYFTGNTFTIACEPGQKFYVLYEVVAITSVTAAASPTITGGAGAVSNAFGTGSGGSAYSLAFEMNVAATFTYHGITGVQFTISNTVVGGANGTIVIMQLPSPFA